VTRQELDMHLKLVQNSLKIALGYSQTDIEYQNQLVDENSRHTICKEPLLTIPVVIYTKKNFYLLSVFNEKLEMLISAGLIDFWSRQLNDKTLLSNVSGNERKILTIKHLFGAFCILLVGFVISIVVFLFELLLHKLRRLSRNFLFMA
jgi:hypothetical protein